MPRRPRAQLGAILASVLSAAMLLSSSASLIASKANNPCRMNGYFVAPFTLVDFTCIGDCGSVEPPCELDVVDGDILDGGPISVACLCDGVHGTPCEVLVYLTPREGGGWRITGWSCEDVSCGECILNSTYGVWGQICPCNTP